MMPLETSRLIIRNYLMDDAPSMMRNSGGRGMREHLPDDVLHTIDEARAHIDECIHNDRDRQYPVAYGIALKESGELIGEIGLSEIKQGVEINYYIAEAHQHNGYAAEAVTGFCRWAMANLPIDRIYGMTKSTNIPSCRAMERAGFSLSEEKEIVYYGELFLFRIYIFA